MLKPLLFCLFILSTTGEKYEKTVDISVSTRIIHGNDVDPNSISYQASIRTLENFHFCGGSIISRSTILTAAHCVCRADPKNLIVVVGSVFLDSGGDAYNVSSYKIHEKYKTISHINDIAMIFLENEIQLKDNIRIIKPKTTMIYFNTPVDLTGWGMKKYPGPISNQLQIIRLKTISNILCSFMFFRKIINSQICTLTHVGEGVCIGDSGSSLVADDQIVGIVSTGMPCATGIPDIYTRVSYYAYWINRNMK